MTTKVKLSVYLLAGFFLTVLISNFAYQKMDTSPPAKHSVVVAAVAAKENFRALQEDQVELKKTRHELVELETKKIELGQKAQELETRTRGFEALLAVVLNPESTLNRMSHALQEKFLAIAEQIYSFNEDTKTLPAKLAWQSDAPVVSVAADAIFRKSQPDVLRPSQRKAFEDLMGRLRINNSLKRLTVYRKFDTGNNRVAKAQRRSLQHYLVEHYGNDVNELEFRERKAGAVNQDSNLTIEVALGSAPEGSEQDASSNGQ